MTRLGEFDETPNKTIDRMIQQALEQFTNEKIDMESQS